MLDKQSKYVLKALIAAADEDNMVCDLDNIYLKTSKYTESQINDSINYMCEEGYITSSYDFKGNVDISIEYKGLHYKDFSRMEFKRFIMKSILTPIIVSIITTLLSLWFKGPPS